jgi:L-alanine-DL-glutamate epimerase-like enolase superfamily enzyme
MDRRTLMTGMLGTAAASLWTPPDAFALGLPKDKIKRIRYYKTPTDAAGRPNVHQPTFNQSTNVVTIETEGGLIGIGEGGEPSTMEQCASNICGSACIAPISIRRAARRRIRWAASIWRYGI